MIKDNVSYKTGMRNHYEISSLLLDLDNQQIVQVGLALGMNYAKLKRMRSLPGDMVAAWLRREDDVLEVSGVPTWKVLSEALKDTRQTGLAMKIQQKYLHGSSSQSARPYTAQQMHNYDIAMLLLCRLNCCV